MGPQIYGSQEIKTDIDCRNVITIPSNLTLMV